MNLATGERILVTHWGAVTSVGATAKESALGFRASVNGLRESAVLGADGEALTMATVPILDPFLLGADRLVALMRIALADFLHHAGGVLPSLRCKAYVLLDEVLGGPGRSQRGTAEEAIAYALREDLLGVLGVSVGVEVEASGSTGLAEVLSRIRSEQAQGAYEAALVVAVHSDYCPVRVGFLESHSRVYRSGNLDGILLGECAAAFLVVSAGARSRAASAGGLQIELGSLTREQAGPTSDHGAFAAAGLTVAARQVTESHAKSGGRVGWLSSDASFELFRLHELTSVLVRLQSRLGAPQVLDAPNQRIGHLGCAIGAVQIVHAAEAWLRQFAPASECLCLFGADHGARAAMLLRPLV